MEDYRPEDYRPWISSGVKFQDREWEIVWLIKEHKMVYKGGVLENSFIFQSHELVMNLVSNVGGKVIFDSRELSRSKNWQQY